MQIILYQGLVEKTPAKQILAAKKVQSRTFMKRIYKFYVALLPILQISIRANDYQVNYFYELNESRSLIQQRASKSE